MPLPGFFSNPVGNLRHGIERVHLKLALHRFGQVDGRQSALRQLAVHPVHLLDVTAEGAVAVDEHALAVQRYRSVEGVGQGARLGSAPLHQHKLSVSVGCRRTQLGARRDRGDQVQQPPDDFGGQRTIGLLPGRRRHAFQVRNQQRHVHHHVAIKQAARQLLAVEVPAAQLAFPSCATSSSTAVK